MTSAADSWNIERQWDYACDNFFNVKVRGDIAYCTTTYGLVLVDVSDPAEPEIFQRIPFEGAGLGMELIGTLLYICDNEAGLRIFSIADPELPVEIGRCPDLPNPIRLQVRDTLAFVSNYRAGLGIVSIADPYHPERIGWLNVGGDCDDVALYEDYALMACGSLKLIDIEDPEQPEQVALFPNMTTSEIEIRDHYYFTNNFSIYNIEDPFEPRQVYDHDGAGSWAGGGFDFQDNLIFILNTRPRDYCLQCYNLSNVESPRFLGGCNPFYGSGIGIDGIDLEYEEGYCYITYGEDGFSICDLRDIDNAEEVGVIINPADFVDVAYYEDYVYAADENRAWIYIFSVADPIHPELVGYVRYDNIDYYLPIDFGPIVVEEDLMFSVEKYRYYVDDERFEREGLYIYSLENPEQPDELGFVEHIGLPVNEMVFDDGYIYTAGSSGHFTAINVDDPTNPFITDYYGVSRYRTLGIDIQDSLIMLISDDSLVTYDKSNLDSIHVISRQILREYYRLRDILIVGDYAYITFSGHEWMSVVSIEDPEHPEEVYFTDELGSYGYKLDYHDGFLLISEMYSGMEVYSLEDPERPQLAGRFNTPDRANHAIFKDEMILVADRCNFGIYDASAIFSAWYLGLSEESHDFGEVYIDSSALWELTIRNMSDRDREVTNITTDSEAFSCPFDHSFTLRANSDTSFTINFTPSVDTAYTCIMNIVSGEHTLDVMLTGQGKEYSNINDAPTVIYDFALQQSYPNPFNHSTTIRFDLPHTSQISITLTDLTGRRIATLLDDRLTAGQHQLTWDAKDYPAGMYLCRMEADGFRKVRKIALVK